MESAKDRGGMVEMLAENEERIGRLYKVYAAKFPRYGEFWSGLAAEEANHASWIRRLYERADGQVRFDEERFRAKPIRISLNYLAEKILQAKGGEMSLADALNVAIELETNMIEREYFDVFNGDSPELKKTLDALREETSRHVDKLRKLWLKKGMRKR